MSNVYVDIHVYVTCVTCAVYGAPTAVWRAELHVYGIKAHFLRDFRTQHLNR
eukprot:COSAG03_NODE_22125_length_295_cov_0.755102_1_plen_51_part_10